MSYGIFTQVKTKNKMLPLILALFIVLMLATGFAHKKVAIHADGVQIAVRTLHSKPEDVLNQAGITLGPKDEYRLSTPSMGNGTVLSVYRAVPVTVHHQGKEDVVVTGKPTAGELAESLGYARTQIRVEPGDQAPITANMHITIVVLSEKLVEREMDDPFPVIRQPDATLEKGVERVVEEGQAGKKLVTVRLKMADGVQVGEEQVSEKIKEAPKPQVVHVGTRDTIDTSRGAIRFSRVETMEATAYLPTDGSVHGITATGIPARHGIVAVDPDVIPLGTRVYIPGYGMALAADVGGAIVGDKIDLCMEDYSEAMRFGRRAVKVYILE